MTPLMNHLFSAPRATPELDPLVQRLSDDALELFYAQALATMVRDTLRPALSRAKAGAKVPMHKVAMQMQMGRPVDDSQEKALSRAWSRTGTVRWDALTHGTTAEVRLPHWRQTAQMLTEVRNDVHDARNGPANVNVQPLLSLLDSWHNVPILMIQQGPRAIDPKRVGQHGELLHALQRMAQATVEQETAALRTVADQTAGETGSAPVPRARRTP